MQVAFASLGYQCITSILGADHADKSNWTTLEGAKEILFVPDNDAPGAHYIKTVAEILSAFGNPPKMRIVRLPNLPPKGDICDYLKQQPELADWNELDSLKNHSAKDIIRERLDKLIAENMQPISDEWFGWEEPEEIADSILLPVEPLPHAIIPEPYRDFIVDVAYRMQCPIDFVAISSIVSTGSVIGAGCCIKPKKFDPWRIVPNSWGAGIGDPGILKSPSLEAFSELLVSLEKESKEEFENAKKQYEADMLVYKHKLKDAESAIAEAVKNKDSLEIEDAKRNYETVLHEEPAKLTRRRHKTNDITIEKLGELLGENSRGILISRDELIGLFRSWEKDGHESDRAFFLEAWNGLGHYTYDRIGRGTIDIENTCVSLLGGIQPDKLEYYLYQTLHGDNDGFIQRLQVAVYPDEPDWNLVDQPAKTDAKQKAFRIIKNLANMNFVQCGAMVDDSKMPYFHFSNAAQIIFNEWVIENQKKVKAEQLPHLKQHLIKYRKLVPTLALIFHLIDIAAGKIPDEPGISYEAMEKAAAWSEYLESHARRIYGLCSTFEQQAVSALAKKIKANKLQNPFTERDIYRKQWHRLNDKVLVHSACEELVDAKWLCKKTIQPTFRGGKVKILYFIHPKFRGTQ